MSMITISNHSQVVDSAVEKAHRKFKALTSDAPIEPGAILQADADRKVKASDLKITANGLEFSGNINGRDLYQDGLLLESVAKKVGYSASICEVIVSCGQVAGDLKAELSTVRKDILISVNRQQEYLETLHADINKTRSMIPFSDLRIHESALAEHTKDIDALVDHRNRLYEYMSELDEKLSAIPKQRSLVPVYIFMAAWPLLIAGAAAFWCSF